MIWLPATLLAGLFQAWRTAVQQRVRAELSVNAAGLVRYLFGFPVGCLLLATYLFFSQASLPGHHDGFWVHAAMGGVAQILGTNLLILAFGFRNYVVGSAYAKTEAVQGAILAMILLGEHLSVLTWIGIGVGVVGVVVLSAGGQRPRLSDLAQPAALCGLGAGLLFALTSVFIKRATLVVETTDKVLAALVTLVAVLGLQALLQGAYVAVREREQLARIARSWRVSSQVGLLAAMGSACWFTGFATAPVALVRAVGQVEVIFTLAFGRYYLREPLARSELAGLLTVGMGVVLALAGNF
ncbi:EamA family transporter [Aquisediminimonas profunda]|uniref:EamA family transporter n=1 Tax=Aquisediminimonas profunda TaxID=1550733 RepID=UPI001C632531|nr:EamA family transporter [Aquisediminimonas profunda]